jgi:hypothetical protein
MVTLGIQMAAAQIWMGALSIWMRMTAIQTATAALWLAASAFREATVAILDWQGRNRGYPRISRRQASAEGSFFFHSQPASIQNPGDDR